MNNPFLVALNTSASEQMIKSGALVVLVCVVLLYSWKTGNTPRIETENFSLSFQSSNEK